VTESYDGSFNLANVPGGGTMARLMWRSAGRTGLAQTDDIVTYSGKRSITVDLAMATSTLTDPSLPAALRYPFVSTSRVSTVRWDPNEDPGARTWHIYSIRLAADCGTRTTFALTWHDSYFTPASTARVWAISSTGHGTVLGTATEQSGSNTFTVRTAGLAAGRYTLRVDVTTPNGTVMSASSGSPLVVSK
jgi:hypothetical protein